MPTPVELIEQYRNIRVNAPLQACSVDGLQHMVTHTIQLRTYFMMNWTEGSEQRTDFSHVTQRDRGTDRASRAAAATNNLWFEQHKEAIRTAAMGKGAPGDYALALEWAVRSGLINDPTQHSIQAFCNERLGIDCSGFATNYLCAAGKRTYSPTLVRNSGAQSYYNPSQAVNDASQVRQGDLLVWMTGNRPKSDPGHIAVVQSYTPASMAGGNMEVCEATGAANANPKLLNSRYTVTRIFPQNDRTLHNAVMILEFTRHGTPGSKACVIRV